MGMPYLPKVGEYTNPMDPIRVRIPMIDTTALKLPDLPASK